LTLEPLEDRVVPALIAGMPVIDNPDPISFVLISPKPVDTGNPVQIPTADPGKIADPPVTDPVDIGVVVTTDPPADPGATPDDPASTGGSVTPPHLGMGQFGMLFRVVPADQADGKTTFATLADAVAAAPGGCAIQIEPGSNPGGATVWADDLTIQGDPDVGADGLQAGGTEAGVIELNGHNDTVTGLFLDGVTIAPGATGQTISADILNGDVRQVFSAKGGVNGDNVVAGNTFLADSHLFLGNSLGSKTDTAANDQVTDNTFPDRRHGGAIVIDNETAGLVVTGNVITSKDDLGVTDGSLGFLVSLWDCTGTVSGNTIDAPAGKNNFGLEINGYTAGTNLTVNDNTIDASGIAIQLSHVRDGITGLPDGPYVVSLAGNTFVGSGAGLYFLGGDFSTVSAGGTNNGVDSAGGNDFSGIEYNPDGRAAIMTSNSSTGNITARNNIFSVDDPTTVLMIGGATVDVGDPLPQVPITQFPLNPDPPPADSGTDGPVADGGGKFVPIFVIFNGPIGEDKTAPPVPNVVKLAAAPDAVKPAAAPDVAKPVAVAVAVADAKPTVAAGFVVTDTKGAATGTSVLPAAVAAKAGTSAPPDASAAAAPQAPAANVVITVGGQDAPPAPVGDTTAARTTPGPDLGEEAFLFDGAGSPRDEGTHHARAAAASEAALAQLWQGEVLGDDLVPVAAAGGEAAVFAGHQEEASPSWALAVAALLPVAQGAARRRSRIED
jgi:hypothetical protein